MKGMLYRQLVVAPVVLLLAACHEEGHQSAAVDVPEDPRGIWYVNDPASTEIIDHSAWDSFLGKYHHENPNGDGVNRIAYFEVTEEDHQALDMYVETLGRIPIATYNRDEQIAFWMNLYNAAIINFAQRPNGGCTDFRMLILQGGDERSHCRGIINFSQRVGRLFTNLPILVLQSHA